MTPCGAVTPLVPRYLLVAGDVQTTCVAYFPHGAQPRPSSGAGRVWRAAVERIPAGHWCADHCHIIGADDLGAVTVDQ